MDEIAPGIFAISGLKMGRSYLLEGSDGIALVDTSSNSASARILASITEAGHRPEELRAIVATHYHFDHTGNAAALIERSGAQLCVHADDAPYVEGRTQWMRPNPPFGFLNRFAPAPFALKVDRVLQDGDVLPYAGDLRVIHAPGHTPGHIALYSRERRVLFAGDALMNSAGLRLPMAMSTHDMDAARRSICQLAELDFDIALPGHGHPIIGRANEKIADWAKRWVSPAR
ncbi:MAG: MBL fold metallo-hydrolase [Chloroflexi bacterium]|nr:MBL fold metallo-hydrolase [Chloroflexota bacterium]